MFRINGKGYAEVYIEGKYYLAHRLLMEVHLGRALNPSEVVHHVDRNKLNNTIGNLEVVKQADHKEEHAAEITEGFIQWCRSTDGQEILRKRGVKLLKWRSTPEGKEFFKGHYSGLSISMKGDNNHNFGGAAVTDHQREVARKQMTERYEKQGFRKVISEVNLGNTNAAGTRTKEQRERMTEANRRIAAEKLAQRAEPTQYYPLLELMTQGFGRTEICEKLNLTAGKFNLRRRNAKALIGEDQKISEYFSKIN